MILSHPGIPPSPMAIAQLGLPFNWFFGWWTEEYLSAHGLVAAGKPRTLGLA